MAQINTLLELRSKIKSKKPEFIRQDYQRRMRLGRKLKWRKPKGIHSKIRHHFKGRRKMPSPGYKSPREVRGLHASGLAMVMGFSVDDVKKIKNGSEGIVIPGNVGMKKRLEILRKAKEFDVKILNMSIDDGIKKIENFINSKKKSDAKEVKKEAKETKKEEPKEQRESEKSSEKLTEEQRKKADKREKDKLLTKKA